MHANFTDVKTVRNSTDRMVFTLPNLGKLLRHLSLSSLFYLSPPLHSTSICFLSLSPPTLLPHSFFFNSLFIFFFSLFLSLLFFCVLFKLRLIILFLSFFISLSLFLYLSLSRFLFLSLLFSHSLSFSFFLSKTNSII